MGYQPNYLLCVGLLGAAPMLEARQELHLQWRGTIPPATPVYTLTMPPHQAPLELTFFITYTRLPHHQIMRCDLLI